MTPRPAAACHLLTCFATVVCYDLAERTLVHVPPEAVHPGVEPITVRHDLSSGRLAMLRYGPPDALSRTRTATVLPALPQFGPFEVVPGPRDRLVHLKAAERFLCADTAGAVQVWSQLPSKWETFLPVAAEDLADLAFLQANRWVMPGQAGPQSITLGRDFTLTVGPHPVSLPDNLPLPFRTPAGDQPGFTRVSLFVDGWKLEEIVLYRPLIYYAAFGNENVLRMLEVSLATLDRLAGFDGDILLITDRTATQLAPLLPTRLAHAVHVWNVQGDDRFDYVVARYLVPHWPAAAGFQPLLYADTDVCFDGNLGELLTRLVLYPKLSAQTEAFSRLSSTESVGARLLQEDGCEVGDTYGFNSGVIGIPAIPSHGETLLKIAETMYRYAAARGSRRPLNWFDQSVANYVAFKTASFDPTLLSPYVRQGDGQDGASPTGLLHVWGAGPGKLDAMRRYLADRVRAHAT